MHRLKTQFNGRWCAAGLGDEGGIDFVHAAHQVSLVTAVTLGQCIADVDTSDTHLHKRSKQLMQHFLVGSVAGTCCHCNMRLATCTSAFV